MRLTRRFFAAVLSCCVTSVAVQAATLPYTEDFTNSVSNWADNSAMNLLNHAASGGPDAGSYASTSFSLLNRADQSVVLFRAQDEFNSSDHAFEGNWISQSVGQFSTYVRHNAPLPLTYFTRFSAPGNFPGGVAVKFVPVLPDTWTQLYFNIHPSNPEFVSFEGTSFGAVFSNVGNIQVGVRVPTALAVNSSQFTFDIDKASIAVPEPASIGIAAVAGIAVQGWRRRRLR